MKEDRGETRQGKDTSTPLGSSAGPIGAAIGGAIGALIGRPPEHKIRQRVVPEVRKNTPKEIRIRALTNQQQVALLDLVVLAMYADGHIAAAEEKRVQRLLTLMGHDSEYDMTRHYDDSVARARRHLATPEDAQNWVATLARSFSAPPEKQLIREVLQDFLGSDGSIDNEETRFLASANHSFN